MLIYNIYFDAPSSYMYIWKSYIIFLTYKIKRFFFSKEYMNILLKIILFFSTVIAYPRRRISLQAAFIAADWLGLPCAQCGVTRNEHEQKNAYGFSHVQIVVRIKVLMVRRFVSYGDVLWRCNALRRHSVGGREAFIFIVIYL